MPLVRAVRGYLILDFLSTCWLFVAWSLAIYYMFATLFIASLLQGFSGSRDLIETLGCGDDHLIFNCLQELFSKNPQYKIAFHAALPASMLGVPFNSSTFFVIALLALGIAVTYFSAQFSSWRKHNARHEKLKSEPTIASFLDAVRHEIAFTDIRFSDALGAEAIVLRRSVFIHPSLYLEWRTNGGRFTVEMLHCLLHERMHARELFPFERLQKSVHRFGVVIFVILPIAIYIGLISAIPVYWVLAKTAFKRRVMHESIADTLASTKLLSDPKALTDEDRINVVAANRDSILTLKKMLGALQRRRFCSLGLAFCYLLLLIRQ